MISSFLVESRDPLFQPFLCWLAHEHECSACFTLTTPTNEIVHWRNASFGITIPAGNIVAISSEPRAQSALLHSF
jgi:hypothetical protein